MEKIYLTVSSLRAFIAKPPLQNYKNNIANTIKMGAEKEENQKRQKEKMGSMKEQCRRAKK